MPKHHRTPFSILDLVKQLITDAVHWSNDEIALTRLDASRMMRRYVFGLALILTSFAILIAAVFTLAQTLIGPLAAYLNGHVAAGLIVSLVLFGMALVLVLLARYVITYKVKAKGMIFRRIISGRTE